MVNDDEAGVRLPDAFQMPRYPWVNGAKRWREVPVPADGQAERTRRGTPAPTSRREYWPDNARTSASRKRQVPVVTICRRIPDLHSERFQTLLGDGDIGTVAFGRARVRRQRCAGSDEHPSACAHVEHAGDAHHSPADSRSVVPRQGKLRLPATEIREVPSLERGIKGIADQTLEHPSAVIPAPPNESIIGRTGACAPDACVLLTPVPDRATFSSRRCRETPRCRGGTPSARYWVLA